jgi:DNA polymerase elongation subunit (family B)
MSVASGCHGAPAPEDDWLMDARPVAGAPCPNIVQITDVSVYDWQSPADAAGEEAAKQNRQYTHDGGHVSRCIVSCKDQAGRNYALHVENFRLRFLAVLPQGSTQRTADGLAALLSERMGLEGERAATAVFALRSRFGECELANADDAERLGAAWVPVVKTHAVAEIYVPSFANRRWAASILAKPIFLPGVAGRVTLEVCEQWVKGSLQFCIDKETTPCGDLAVDTSRARPAPVDLRVCHPACVAEFVVPYAAIEAADPDPERPLVFPMRGVAWDIETDYRTDHILQIGASVRLYFGAEDRGGARATWRRVVFCLDETAPTDAEDKGLEIRWFRDERNLLLAFGAFLAVEADADMAVTYNGEYFDFVKLLQRAAALGCETRVFRWSRFADRVTLPKAVNFSTKAYGDSESTQIDSEGRLAFVDLMVWFKRDTTLKWPDYKLNTAAAELLPSGECKIDLDYTEIPKRQAAGPGGRKELAVYCIQDCDLLHELVGRCMVMPQLVEMARVTCTFAERVVHGGQSGKATNQIVRAARARGYFVDRYGSSPPGPGYQGATVLAPTPGFYEEPVITLDFKSLYPYLMIGHNLCYTTLVRDPAVAARLGAHVERTEVALGNVTTFLRAEGRVGVLPAVLGELLEARAEAKAALKRESDPFKKVVLDGRQLALKISANSIYGYTGATVGKMYCPEIAATTTCHGRLAIEETKRIVEAEVSPEYWYGRAGAGAGAGASVPAEFAGMHNAKVIYGDTDSVMVWVPWVTLHDSFALGDLVGAMVSARLPGNLTLENEKSYKPYILGKRKKVYAGKKYTSAGGAGVMEMKGFETVKRSYMPLLRTLQKDVLSALVEDVDVQGAQRLVTRRVAEMVDGKVPIEEFIMTCQLKAQYANPDGMCQSVVAREISARSPATAPNVGDRVAFVYALRPKSSKAVEKAMCAAHAKATGAPLDLLYILEHGIEPAMIRTFEAFMPDPRVLFNPARITLTQRQMGQRPLSEFLASMASAAPAAPGAALVRWKRGREGEGEGPEVGGGSGGSVGAAVAPALANIGPAAAPGAPAAKRPKMQRLQPGTRQGSISALLAATRAPARARAPDDA